MKPPKNPPKFLDSYATFLGKLHKTTPTEIPTTKKQFLQLFSSQTWGKYIQEYGPKEGEEKTKGKGKKGASAKKTSSPGGDGDVSAEGQPVPVENSEGQSTDGQKFKVLDTAVDKLNKQIVTGTLSGDAAALQEGLKSTLQRLHPALLEGLMAPPGSRASESGDHNTPGVAQDDFNAVIHKIEELSQQIADFAEEWRAAKPRDAKTITEHFLAEAVLSSVNLVEFVRGISDGSDILNIDDEVVVEDDEDSIPTGEAEDDGETTEEEVIDEPEEVKHTVTKSSAVEDDSAANVETETLSQQPKRQRGRPRRR